MTGYPRQPTSGFTLVEVMIGLALLSLMLLFLFSGLRTTALSWEASDKVSSENDENRLIWAFVRRQLKQTVPIVVRGAREFEVIFKGERDSLRFVTKLPPYRGSAGLYVVTLRLDQMNDGRQSLVYTYQPLHTDFNVYEDGVMTTEQILLEGLTAIEFDYFGKAEIDDDYSAWFDEWTPTNRLPEAVRLNIYWDDAEKDWPSLIVKIPSQVEVGQAQLTLLDPSPDD